MVEAQEDQKLCKYCGEDVLDHPCPGGACNNVVFGKQINALREELRLLYATLPLSGDGERITLGMTVYGDYNGRWHQGTVEGVSKSMVTLKLADGFRVVKTGPEYVFVDNPDGKEGD